MTARLTVEHKGMKGSIEERENNEIQRSHLLICSLFVFSLCFSIAGSVSKESLETLRCTNTHIHTHTNTHSHTQRKLCREHLDYSPPWSNPSLDLMLNITNVTVTAFFTHNQQTPHNGVTVIRCSSSSHHVCLEWAVCL